MSISHYPEFITKGTKKILEAFGQLLGRETRVIHVHDFESRNEEIHEGLGDILKRDAKYVAAVFYCTPNDTENIASESAASGAASESMYRMNGENIETVWSQSIRTVNIIFSRVPSRRLRMKMYNIATYILPDHIQWYGNNVDAIHIVPAVITNLVPCIPKKDNIKYSWRLKAIDFEVIRLMVEADFVWEPIGPYVVLYACNLVQKKWMVTFLSHMKIDKRIGKYTYTAL